MSGHEQKAGSLRVGKFTGYCPECQLMLSLDLDGREPTDASLSCPRCGWMDTADKTLVVRCKKAV